jgi:hypothetical protein
MTNGAITTTITDAATNLGTQALPIIGAAVTLGITFWGAKLLWSKFKGMAK